jgi:hypothetical protein
MDTATHPKSAPEAALNVELFESNFKLIAGRALEIVDDGGSPDRIGRRIAKPGPW